MQINTTSRGSETFANSANSFSKIFEAETPDGLVRLIPDRSLVVMKLKDSNGDEISNDAKVVFSVREPVNDYPSKVDETSYRPYGNKDIAEQMDNTKNEHMRIDIDRGGVKLPELNTFEIWLTAPEVVDWTKSTIEINDVKEQSA